MPGLALLLFEPTAAELGAIGETLAARHLAAHGYRVVARRMTTPHGELDLVARRGAVLVGVEVKSARLRPLPRPRGSPPIEGDALRWRPGLRWRFAQPARARRALRWLAAHVGWARETRLDLVEVLVGPPHRVLWEEDARAAHARPPASWRSSLDSGGLDAGRAPRWPMD